MKVIRPSNFLTKSLIGLHSSSKSSCPSVTFILKIFKHSSFVLSKGQTFGKIPLYRSKNNLFRLSTENASKISSNPEALEF